MKPLNQTSAKELTPEEMEFVAGGSKEGAKAFFSGVGDFIIGFWKEHTDKPAMGTVIKSHAAQLFSHRPHTTGCRTVREPCSSDHPHLEHNVFFDQ